MFARACALRNFYTAGQMSHSEQVGTGVDLLDSGILFGEKYLYDADEKEERITPATFDVTKIHAACEEVACYSTFPSDYGRFSYKTINIYLPKQ